MRPSVVRVGCLLTVLLPLLPGGFADAGEEGVTFQTPWKLPTIDGGTPAVSDFRGTKLLLVEFASW